jgi:hypothetical protein
MINLESTSALFALIVNNLWSNTFYNLITLLQKKVILNRFFLILKSNLEFEKFIKEREIIN